MIANHSPVVVLGVRAATPLASLVAVYLLFAGHNQPGGGFAAGLVAGAVVALRVVAGVQKPVAADRLLAVGVVIVGLVALAPVFAGEELLDQVIESVKLPLLGKVKTGSALIFDIGVMAVVVGLILAVLDGLGARELAVDAGRRKVRR